MIVLYILGGLLLLFLLTLLPVRAAVAFREGFSLEVRYLFFRFPILPGETEEAPQGAEDPEKAPEEQEKEKKDNATLLRIKAALKREGLGGFLQGLGELLKLLGRAAGGILKGLRLKRFDLYLCLAGAGDAAAAAVRYGQISGGVYAACGGLFTLMPCKHKGVTIDLNYAAEENAIDFTAEFSIRPITVIKSAVVLFFKGLRPLKKIL